MTSEVDIPAPLTESAASQVLIVDDQPERAAMVAEALAGDDWTLSQTSAVDDLEATLGADSPWDAVICSVDLMNVSWASVRRAMRGFDVQVPVIAFGDDRNADRMATALGLGAADYFVRPHEKHRLFTRSVERAVHHRRLQRMLKDSNRELAAANAQLRHSLKVLEQDQRAGRQVQMAMLPPRTLQQNGYWFSHQILPSLYLSGDFTDYFQVGDREIVFFLADVSGHGSSSAFATVLLKNLFARKRSDYLRKHDRSVTEPLAMLRLANRELLELAVSKYATMVVGVLDFANHQLRYSIAGHLPAPVMIDGDGARYLEGEGSPVGLMPEPEYSEHTIDLADQFMLLLMSDGVLETLTGMDLIAKEQALLKRLDGPPAPPSELATRIGWDELAAGELEDDIAGLFISRGFV